MEPDGDPEARIRDLERPLAHQARANELGVHPAAVPTSAAQGFPQPDPYSGSPYYAPPQHVVRKRRPRLLWLVPFGVLLLLGAVGLTVHLVAGNSEFTPDTPAPPTIAGGGGPIDAPQAEPRAPRAAAPEPVPTVAAGQSLSISGIEQHRGVVCTGGAVSVSGVGNTVEIRGDCAVVTVSGFDNVVTVESARSITASGFDNRVTYSTGEPQIANSGSGNVVAAG